MLRRFVVLQKLHILAYLMCVYTVNVYSLTLFPSKDTYIYAGNVSENYGSEASLLLKNSSTGTNTRMIIISFDIAAISETYEQILLKLTQTSGGVATVYIASTVDTWEENTCAWDNAPEAAIVAYSGGVRDGKSIYFDVTDLVMEKVKQNQKSVSLKVFTDDIINSPISYGSRESGENTPQLIFSSAMFIPNMAQYKYGLDSATCDNGLKYAADTVGNINLGYQKSRYGGWTGQKFQSTGYFRTFKLDGVWYMADPDGYLFYQVGITSVVEGGSRKLPDDLFTINLNMMGNWGDFENITGIAHTHQINFMLTFKNTSTELSDLYEADILPVFDSEFERYCYQLAVEGTDGLVTSPWLLGYFQDNELPFHKNQLSLSLGLSSDNAQYVAADAWMIDRYGPSYSLSDITATDEADYQGYVCETYYRITSQALRAADPNHLIIGTRFHGGGKYVNQLFAAAGPYIDIISVNYYSRWEPEKEAIDMWVSESGKPFIVTEFYVKGNDSGLENSDGAGWNVQTQYDRALFFENWCLKLLNHPGSLGWHWFRWLDKNNSNKGLVDTTFAWYERLRTSFEKIGRDVYRLRSNQLFGNTNYNEQWEEPVFIKNDVNHIFSASRPFLPQEVTIYDLRGRKMFSVPTTTILARSKRLTIAKGVYILSYGNSKKASVYMCTDGGLRHLLTTPVR